MLHAHCAAEFFLQFAEQRLHGRLTRLDLTAWKLPPPAQVPPFLPTRKQGGPTALDHRTNNRFRFNATAVALLAAPDKW